MNRQALKIAMAGGLLISSALAAQPLKDLQDRLAAMRSEQPIRVKVDVELQHKGTAPLHLNSDKQRGRVIIEAGPWGVKAREQKRTGSTSHVSFWRSKKEADPDPLIDDVEAHALIDPAGWIGSFLNESTLVDDQMATWEGQAARLLLIQPSDLPAELEVSRGGEPKPAVVEAKLWLGEDGLPLALERTAEIRLPGLKTTVLQTFTFQQVGGRLLVARSTEAASGAALAVLRGSDVKKMKVTVD